MDVLPVLETLDRVHDELSWEPDNFLLKAWVATVDSRRALDTLVDAFGGCPLGILKLSPRGGAPNECLDAYSSHTE